MSWQGRTLFPVLESVFGGDNAKAPTDPVEAARMCDEAGHADVGRYLRGLTSDQYENVLWSANLDVVNREFVEDASSIDADIERFFADRDPENMSDSGYPNFDYEEAYDCK